MAGRKAHILDLPNELLDIICQKCVVFDHVQESKNPKIFLMSRWRHEPHYDNELDVLRSVNLSLRKRSFIERWSIWSDCKDNNTASFCAETMSKKQKESLSWFSWDTLDVADQNLLDPNIREAGHGRLTTRKKATSGQLKPPHTKPLRISYPSNFTPNWYRATIIKNVESWHLYEMNYNSGGCELDCDEDGYPVFYSTFGNLIVEPGHPNCMAIARTCTRLRDIAMRVYYSENTFTFTDTAAMELFASHLSYFERSGAMIRNMSLEVDQFSMMWKGKEKQSKFFSPMESSEENGEPQVKTHFAYMFPNVQYLEIDFFKARNDWNFGGKGTMEFIDVLRHHVRVPRARILNVSHLPEYSRSVEKELMGLEALDDGLAELISIENTPGLNNPLSKRMLRETREGKFVSVTLA